MTCHTKKKALEDITEFLDLIEKSAKESFHTPDDYLADCYYNAAPIEYDAHSKAREAVAWLKKQSYADELSRAIAAFKDMQLHKVELLPMGDGYFTEWDKGYDEAMSDAIEYLQKQVFPCEQ